MRSNLSWILWEWMLFWGKQKRCFPHIWMQSGLIMLHEYEILCWSLSCLTSLAKISVKQRSIQAFLWPKKSVCSIIQALIQRLLFSFQTAWLSLWGVQILNKLKNYKSDRKNPERIWGDHKNLSPNILRQLQPCHPSMGRTLLAFHCFVNATDYAIVKVQNILHIEDDSTIDDIL